MVKKLAVAALLLAMVALATATTVTTTVTTMTFDSDTASEQQKHQCQGQIQGRQFQSCQKYLSPRKRISFDGEQEVLEMTTEKRSKEEHLKDCCQQLEQVPTQCRCEAIKQALHLRQQQKGSGWKAEQQLEAYKKAMDLPNACQMKQPQQCEIRAIFV